eukprot:scaffold83347_cov42-Attheya_sp.AAC.3
MANFKPFCRIDDCCNRLRFYLTICCNDEISSEYSAPHGMVDLSLCTTVKSADLKAHKRNSFEVSTAETTFLLYADSEKEKDDWIGSIGRSIVRCSSTYNRQPTSNLDGDDDDSDTYSNSSNNPYFND